MADVLLYTAQQPVVLEALERDGVSRVRREYIDKKYGDTAWSFQEAYAFFRREMAQRIPRPEGAESPIWLFCDSRWTFASPGSVMMTFRIPEELLLFFDQRVWNRILNLEYLGRDAADEARFAREIAGMGVSDVTKLFANAFYPMQKRKVQESWKRLFSTGDCEETNREAAAWELKKEWLVDAVQI